MLCQRFSSFYYLCNAFLCVSNVCSLFAYRLSMIIVASRCFLMLCTCGVMFVQGVSILVYAFRFMFGACSMLVQCFPLIFIMSLSLSSLVPYLFNICHCLSLILEWVVKHFECVSLLVNIRSICVH